MLNTLTQEQRAFMSIVSQDWIQLCDSGEWFPEKVKAAVIYLYETANMIIPTVIVLPSPLGVLLCRDLLKREGASVGASVGDSVRASVRDSVWASVRASVRDGASVGASVWDSVGASVGDSVGASVWASVGASVRDSVRDGASVGASVWDSVRASVGASVRDSVWDGASVGDFCYTGVFDDGWVSFYDYFDRIGVLNCSRFRAYRDNVVRSGLWSLLAYKNIAIAGMMPIRVNRNEQNRLHDEKDYAVEFGDGYGQHYLSGVFFPPDLFESVTGGRMGVGEILKIQNVEQRMAGLKHVGAERLLRECEADLLDTSTHGNKLYRITSLIEKTPVYLVRFTCPTTKREYMHFVDYHNWVKKPIRQADQAVAGMFGWSLEEYDKLCWEA